MRVLSKVINEGNWRTMFDETSFAAMDVALLVTRTFGN
jgi:hypothetical protein